MAAAAAPKGRQVPGACLQAIMLQQQALCGSYNNAMRQAGPPLHLHCQLLYMELQQQPSLWRPQQHQLVGKLQTSV